MSIKFLTASPPQTQKRAEILAQNILKNKSGKLAEIFGLVGDLGGGKTTFLQGFAKGLGIKEKILSPTFVILKKFKIRGRKFEFFYHIDCYRIQKSKDLLDLGFKEIISNHKNIVAVEWADRVKKIMPEGTTWIKFKFIDAHTRSITINQKVRGPTSN